MRIERSTHDTHAALGLVFGGVLALSAGLATLWLYLRLPLPVCVFRSWTGLPCPTCGTTRMVQRLFEGDLAGALSLNPLVFLLLAAVVIWSVASAARVAFDLPAWRVVLATRELAGVRALALATILAGWVYLIWRGV